MPPAYLSLTAEEKIADLEYLITFVSENYPHLWIKERLTGILWTERRGEFEEWVRQAQDDRAFYRARDRIVAALQNDHTHLVSPQS